MTYVVKVSTVPGDPECGVADTMRAFVVPVTDLIPIVLSQKCMQGEPHLALESL